MLNYSREWAFFIIFFGIFLLLIFWLIVTHFCGMFAWPSEDEKNIFIPSDIEISELQWIKIFENDTWCRYKYATLSRLGNNDTVWLRVVEPTDYGAALPIHGNLVVNKTYINTDINFTWRINPCVPTTIIAIISNNSQKWAEKTKIPQSCLCM